ncbi:MAG TPA: GNAT family protein [Candidatus Lustribacter sp.]|jgi:RimJ/RimL family protein N-acetyltransferase|nr:GNAT family protein [Candidatus Lustribacter sp.]
MKPLYTRRLTLLPVDARNARDLWRVLNAPDLRKYQDIPRIPAEDFERQVRSRPRALDGRSTGRFEWLLQTVTDPVRAVGWISLRVNDRSPHIGEIGYSLIEEARGFGFATEALSAAIEEAFMAGELEEMQACCVPENLPSRGVLNRTGFSEERTIRGGAVIRGRHVDVVLYRLTRAEWRRAAMPARRQMQS